MAKEICISSTPHETRLAILEDDQLAEIYYERENEYTLAGSIYNGRVTRVLPGMQSAFVDIGLERDAFLYVTDFLELEDPEETEELEKAAATGGNTPPREVRHAGAAEPAAERAPERTPERKPERGGRTDRQGRDRRAAPAPEAAPQVFEVQEVAPEAQPASSQDEDGQDETGEPGARRWRGRRRRRGGRSASEASENQSETKEPARFVVEETEESEVAQQIQASAAFPAASTPAPRFSSTPAPFVLPGESLSKYGGTPAEDGDRPEPPPAPPRPASTFKPATLIEAPLEWDGSGLLPGESISRHRSRQPEPAENAAQGIEESGSSPDAFEEEALVDERSEAALETPAPTEPAELAVDEEMVVEELIPELPVHEAPAHRSRYRDAFVEVNLTADLPAAHEAHAAEHPAEAEPQETDPARTDDYTVETVIEQPSADEAVAPPVIRHDEVVTPADHDAPAKNEPDETSDADASHNINPLPPSGFRLFGLGGKKKKSEDEEAAKPEAKPASVASVSAYAPGSGALEEELIEEEEFEAPRHSSRQPRGKAELHPHEDFEEETLPAQGRAGDLGELLQEAHLDHRIQLNFDGKAEEDEEGFDEDDEDEEPAAEGQPAGGDAQAQQRRDRGGRGRRGGRAASAAPTGQANRGRGPSRRSMQTSDLPIISDLLKPGQEILVQIAKEPMAKKGARITSHIALPGRFLVFMPTVSHIGVSRKIASDEERQRLKRILVHERGEASGGFIVRTAAEGASEDELRSDLRFLIHLWNEIKTRSDTSKSPALIYHDLSLIERILRDQVSTNFSSIWVDSQDDYERIVRFLNRFSPSLVRRVKLYTKEIPLFEHFGIQDEISKALRSKVWLKSGGSIVINQTEALVAIDINTGKYVGKSARLEDTILKTNLDAVPEIVRQIRLRDLGGIIVIDFIDMDERKNRFRVMAALEEALKSDRAPTKVLQFNDFGLVAITRKRVKQSLERTLSVPCPTCQATGMVKSPTTVCNEIYTELRKMKKHFEGADVLLRVNPETVKVLKSNNASWLTEFEELVGKNILVKSDPTLHPEQFDVQG